MHKCISVHMHMHLERPSLVALAIYATNMVRVVRNSRYLGTEGYTFVNLGSVRMDKEPQLRRQIAHLKGRHSQKCPPVDCLCVGV